VARPGAALHHDPLGDEQLLERFYRPQPGTAAAVDATEPADAEDDPLAPTATPKKPRPTHYKIVCISLYTDDIERLERMVETLKRRGHTKANKSQLIRAALDQVDLDKVVKSA
jgi:hypothetical protein